LKCGVCGANLTIVSARSGKFGRVRAYGCPHNANRGTCTNNLRVRHDEVEESLLQGLQDSVCRPKVVDYLVDALIRSQEDEESELRAAQIAARARKTQLELEMRRLADAIAASGSSSFLLKVLKEKESDLAKLEAELAATPS